MKFFDALFGRVSPMDDLSPSVGMGGAIPSESYRAVALQLSEGAQRRAVWQDTNADAYATNGYAKIALIYRCLNMIVDAIGTAPLKVYRDEVRAAELPAHPMRAMMRRPNPIMGESTFLGDVVLRAGIAGFCVIEKERDLAGRVIALWPMNSSWLKAKPRIDSRVDWEYRVPRVDKVYLLKAEDVIVFRWADSPDGSAYGVGPLQVCMREAGITNSLVDFLKAYVDSGAVPLHGLIADVMVGSSLTQTQKDDMTRRFMERHGGLSRSSMPIILEGIKDIKRLGLDMDELAYTDLRNLQERGIIHAFGVPASVAQTGEGISGSQGRANALADEGRFYRLTIVPLWSRLDDVFTLNLLPEFESNPAVSLAFDTSDVVGLQEGRDQQATWLLGGVTAGIVSAHTYHRELGLPLPPGDDYYLRTIAMEAIPITDPLNALAPPPAAVGGAVPPADPTAALAAGIVSEILGTAPMLALAATTGAGPSERLAKGAIPSRALIAKVAAAREASIYRFFKAQAKRVIPLVMEGYAAIPIMVHGMDGKAAFSETYTMGAVDWNSEDAQLGRVLVQLHQLAGSTAFTAIPKQFGIETGGAFDVANPNVRAVMDRLGTRVVGIGNTTRQNIADVVTQGLEQGIDTAAISANLTGLFTETYRNRSTAIARTEAMVSYGEASALAYKQSGVVDRAQIFDNAEHTDAYGASDGLTCAERDGLICPLDEMMDHIYADHPNGSAVGTPILIGED